MFLRIFALSILLHCFGFGYSDVEHQELCYGRHLRLSSIYAPPFFNGRMYFTPSTGEPRRLLMENGQVKDPRLKVSVISLTLRDVTERDEGTYSISYNDDDRLFNIVRVNILDCAEEVERSYNSMYSGHIPREAELLEFISILRRRDKPYVLWNRTNPQTRKGSRVLVQGDSWKITKLVQPDNGFYNIRKKDNTLISRIKLTVKEYTRHYTGDDVKKDRLHISYPNDFTPWDVTFSPKGTKTKVTVMEAGDPLETDLFSESGKFEGRIQEEPNGLTIDPVENTDSGVFEFRDNDGNLALVVHLDLEDDRSLTEYIPAYEYVAIIAGIILVIVCCCCCCKKCCCKKSSAKRGSTPQTAEAPAVYYHGTNQPDCPSYSAAPPAPAYSYQPISTLGNQVPTTSPGPLVYNPVDIHVSPTQPEVAVPGGQGAAPAQSIGSDFLSSDSGPTFEFKGTTFPSAPPLSSDSAYCDVYNSDKLNFL
ncbi:uncharacterized protein LOC128363195 isoform X1 [Scomber japonicus]|uniref:uncharacterized protein LOC128363195 isoform X1 n=1 Tax=Scomber japonicus TaxID=13676 RepID=UPI00230695FB|nr:uncharacterized protein LOC128363195 isoform X1 [Scomber japonicus]